jgi:hypothetical protein
MVLAGLCMGRNLSGEAESVKGETWGWQRRPFQVVLRELETLAGHPDRLHRWTRLAIEAAETYA